MKLEALFEPDPRRLAAAGDKYGVAKPFDRDMDAFMEAVDVVTITSPAPCHHENVLCAALHHKPVLCEKPLSRTDAEGEEMIVAMERANVVFAHAWMVRNFLKHADEVQDDEEMLEVHRMIYDTLRAVEPSYLRKDAAEYLRRLGGKLPKLRRQAEVFAREFKRVSAHTNFEMAALSLTGCVRHLEEILAEVRSGTEAPPEASEP